MVNIKLLHYISDRWIPTLTENNTKKRSGLQKNYRCGKHWQKLGLHRNPFNCDIYQRNMEIPWHKRSGSECCSTSRHCKTFSGNRSWILVEHVTSDSLEMWLFYPFLLCVFGIVTLPSCYSRLCPVDQRLYSAVQREQSSTDIDGEGTQQRPSVGINDYKLQLYIIKGLLFVCTTLTIVTLWES